MKYKKIILSLSEAIFISAPALVFAQTIGSMAQAIAGQVVIVGTWIVVIMWVVSGIMFLTAQGDASKLNNAKWGLFAAIFGTILIILAQGAITFVRNSFGI
jgi:ascorbate-specific PTS system EIIC-type component UlaA